MKVYYDQEFTSEVPLVTVDNVDYELCWFPYVQDDQAMYAVKCGDGYTFGYVYKAGQGGRCYGFCIETVTPLRSTVLVDVRCECVSSTTAYRRMMEQFLLLL